MDCDQGVSPQPPLRPAESPIVSSEGKTAFPIFLHIYGCSSFYVFCHFSDIGLAKKFV